MNEPICALCRDDCAREVELIGGYRVYLCLEHSNLWHEYVMDTNEYADYRDLKARYDAEIYGGDGFGAAEFMAAVLVAEKDLYDLAKGWIADMKGKFYSGNEAGMGFRIDRE